MGSGVKISVKGLDELLKKVKVMPERVKEKAADVLFTEATLMHDRAKIQAPKNFGEAGLSGSISVKVLGPMDYEVVAAKDYAPYVEFGTGNNVQIPAGLEAVAAQYRNGGGSKELTPKEAIYQWCKKKGIAENLWWPIYRSIMVNGIHPKPFFFNNYFIAVANIKKKLSEAIAEEMKRK